MTPEKAKEALETLTAEANNAAMVYRILVTENEERRKKYEEGRQAIAEALKKQHKVAAQVKRLRHLSEGLCGEIIANSDTWSTSYHYCKSKGRNACERCGGGFCGTHMKGHRNCYKEPALSRFDTIRDVDMRDKNA